VRKNPKIVSPDAARLVLTQFRLLRARVWMQEFGVSIGVATRMGEN
jgi:hypothetical protein